MNGWAKVGGLGALGLVAAAVLAALSLQLVSQPVGLSSEPLTAGDRLAPAASAKTDTGTTPATTHKRKPPETAATTGTKPSASDDSSNTLGSQSRPSGGDEGAGDSSPRVGGDEGHRNDD